MGVQQAQIEKDNQKLLKKLVEISTGKKPNLHKLDNGGTLGKSHSVAAIEFKAKSLHFNQRKAELERIERENQKIAKKIFCLKSNLKKSQFEKDFEAHEAMKANIARIRKKRVPVYAGRGGGLPPMEHPPRRQGSAPLAGGNEQNALDQNQASDFNTVAHETASRGTISNGAAN